jgi:toxin YoeB
MTARATHLRENWSMTERTIIWTPEAWEDYAWWQEQDRKTLRRINSLIRDCLRTPFTGIGKPEALKGNLSGRWSRRIDDANRLVYRVDDKSLFIIGCRFHYSP